MLAINSRMETFRQEVKSTSLCLTKLPFVYICALAKSTSKKMVEAFAIESGHSCHLAKINLVSIRMVIPFQH